MPLEGPAHDSGADDLLNQFSTAFEDARPQLRAALRSPQPLHPDEQLVLVLVQLSVGGLVEVREHGNERQLDLERAGALPRLAHLTVRQELGEPGSDRAHWDESDGCLAILGTTANNVGET